MAYTPEQYAAAGQFILANLNNPDLIASTASSLGLSANDLLTSAYIEAYTAPSSPTRPAIPSVILTATFVSSTTA